MPLLRYETGIKQDAEVLGDGWPARLEMSRKRVYGAVGLNMEIENPATRGIANCAKDIRLAIESQCHVANMCKQTLTRQVRSGTYRLGAQVHRVRPDDSTRSGCVGALVHGPMTVEDGAMPVAPATSAGKWQTQRRMWRGLFEPQAGAAVSGATGGEKCEHSLL
jgi:hypothetical protein